MKASKILLGVSAGAMAVGLAFGLLELKAHSDYEGRPQQPADARRPRARRTA